MSDDPVDERSGANGGLVEVLPGHCRADHREDARSDYRADTQSRERPRAKALLESILRRFRLADQLVNRLAGKQLAGQVKLLMTPQRVGSFPAASFQLVASSH